MLDTKRNPLDRLESVKDSPSGRERSRRLFRPSRLIRQLWWKMDRIVLSGRAIFHSVASELRTLKSQIALVRYIVYNAIVSIPAQNRK